MRRSIFVVSLLLLSCLSTQAKIVQYQGDNGRQYFTNVDPVMPQRTHPQPPVPVMRAPAQTLRLIQELARQYNIESRLIQAIIRVESNFNPHAVSSAGALGLMQLMPATAERFGVKDPFNPQANIEGGIRFLKHLLRQFPGDLRRVLAAYNAGEYAVRHYNGIPPYPETLRYVKRVMTFYGFPSGAKKIYRFRETNGSILFTNTPR
jgi:soluble lytic murein transglycosylase-like protein